MSEKVLVMTLGKGQKEAGDRYQEATYHFKGGDEYTTSFFGHALFQWLERQGEKMDRVVILGTTGSSWDALLELGEFTEEGVEKLYLELSQAVGEDAVCSEMLKNLSEIISPFFGAKTYCELIPDARTQEGQFDILSIISQQVPSKAALWMDLTHGFRHLPLLELFSALNLEETKDVEIMGLYYGMFDKKRGITPVVELSFAKEMSCWTRALHALEYGQLGALIGLPGMAPFEANLKNLILNEQLNQTAKARGVAKKLLQQLRETEITSRAGALCQPRLIEHFLWAEGDTYCLRQFQCAEKSIKQRDYIHGIILLNEALITHAVPPGGDPLNYENRQVAAENYCTTEEHHLLRKLRNMLAHGTRPTGRGAAKLIKMIDHPAFFDQEIFRILKQVKKQLKS